VELNNTDAEGRLVLADGVAYAVKHLNPEVMFDMATLTGAQGYATGHNTSALYCNDDDLEAAVVRAGRETGDLAHPMPFFPEWFQLAFPSKVADMKKSVADYTNASSACAGQFVFHSAGDFAKAGKMCHIDMAYPVRTRRHVLSHRPSHKSARRRMAWLCCRMWSQSSERNRRHDRRYPMKHARHHLTHLRSADCKGTVRPGVCPAQQGTGAEAASSRQDATASMSAARRERRWIHNQALTRLPRGPHRLVHFGTIRTVPL
jgi:hypothetical protein